ncbi:Membrane associated ring finger 1 [Forsythia ovata]|uniref:Membrane associated ring finger 1 n=1 Tax=Forsythia ovata TaxID=205694 RepID=A0ABD1RI35_9LAMI
MVDEFMVCVDRIIASAACFEGSSSESDRESSINVNEFTGMVSLKKSNSFNGNSIGEGSSTMESVRECRICQEEDEEKDMEAPCACNGTLKFAHRKCIQRWCNKKGGITCEICNQVFSPNYTVPPPRSNADVMTIDIRQAWSQHIGLRDPHFLTFTAADHHFVQSEYEDYTIANSGTLACFRSVVIIVSKWDTHGVNFHVDFVILQYVKCGFSLFAADATLADTPNFNGHKRLWDGAGFIRFLPLSDICSSAGWFSHPLLCGAPFVVHCTMPAEETGVRMKGLKPKDLRFRQQVHFLMLLITGLVFVHRLFSFPPTVVFISEVAAA